MIQEDKSATLSCNNDQTLFVPTQTENGEVNAMAFPCMLYIMEGVQEVLAERYLDNLFGGDTAEP